MTGVSADAAVCEPTDACDLAGLAGGAGAGVQAPFHARAFRGTGVRGDSGRWPAYGGGACRGGGDGRAVAPVVSVQGPAQRRRHARQAAPGVPQIAFRAELVPELRWHLERFAEPGKRGVVFVGPKGGRLCRSNFRKVWNKARASVGLPDLHFHDLRHTGGGRAGFSPARRGTLTAWAWRWPG
ncbi:MAG: tyrosine-type recombinase/integrase [Streptosporangiaceae bacterium]